ncbi:hypothetical protein E8E13_010660 [Curvularia kusanoi]|uniref:Uncharacterized protein n=1 Tax=Curvularia kusanoi TaxID=90978 RepID=A0A9P4TJG8_CURKU|nr:hypothetical protein E8E13_010660 [Curvularia kusanoi]
MAAQLPRHDEKGPRCRNSWRPSDGPLLPQDARIPQRRNAIAEPSDNTRYRAEAAARSRHLTSWGSTAYDQRAEVSTTGTQQSQPSTEPFRNPNLIPVVSRRSQTTSASGSPESEMPLPQVWHPSLDDFIRRTANAYDLVMNYERDAEGGQRWVSKDIAKIRKAGKTLHSDIFALRHLQQQVAQQGDKDEYFIMKIKREANKLKLLCERVQQAISKHEQKCELELLRDGVYAQDEDGNFYKPTSPQRYMDEGGFLQNATSLNVGQETNAHSDRHYEYAKYQYEYHNVDQRPQNPSEDYPSSSVHPPAKRNTSWDDRSLAASFGNNTARDSYTGDRNSRPPLPPRDPVPNSGARLTHSVGTGRRLSSPPYRNASSDSMSQSTQSTSDAKRRRLFATLEERNGKSRKAVMRETAWKREKERGRERSASPVRNKSYHARESRDRQRQRSRSPVQSKAFPNKNEREGKSRREIKREEARDRSPRSVAGRLGKHVLHW